MLGRRSLLSGVVSSGRGVLADTPSYSLYSVVPPQSRVAMSPSFQTFSVRYYLPAVQPICAARDVVAIGTRFKTSQLVS